MRGRKVKSRDCALASDLVRAALVAVIPDPGARLEAYVTLNASLPAKTVDRRRIQLQIS